MAVGHAKVILFGEHAVVHGQPALAAALDVAVRATHRAGPDLHVQLDDLTFYPDDGTRLGEALAALLEALNASETGAVRLSSTIPPGAGLGSSAAMAVALARHWAPDAGLPAVLGAARKWECVFHSNPSGVDHTTSAMGGVLRFQRGADPEFQAVSIRPLPLVIAQVEAGADTGRMVDGVRDRLRRRPGPLTAALTLLGACTREALPALVEGDIDAVGELMDVAHGGLAAIGVSTASLDRACHIARAAGAKGAKLTGAGGGGCVIAACQPQQQAEVAQALEAAGALRVLVTQAGVPSP